MKIVYIYRAVRQELSTPETGPYTTFGILALLGGTATLLMLAKGRVSGTAKPG